MCSVKGKRVLSPFGKGPLLGRFHALSLASIGQKFLGEPVIATVFKYGMGVIKISYAFSSTDTPYPGGW